MGHNWLGVLTNPNFKDKSGPGGCARCHITGGWKYSLAEIGITDGKTSGTGIANYASLFGSTLTSAWTGAAQQKKANTIECMFCHASDYKPGSIANETNHKDYGSGADARTLFNGGKRKPVFLSDDSTGMAANTFQPAPMKSKKWSFDGTTWNYTLENVWLPQDTRPEALASISKTPPNEACMRCHNYAGGGDRNKRGMWFVKGYDVHAEMSCLDCHKTDKMLGGTSSHKISVGLSTDMWARDVFVGGTNADFINPDNHSSECSNSDCHGNRPHKSKLLNDHYAGVSASIGDGVPGGKVDCRTCHIPYQEGQALKDFTRTSGPNPTTGLYDTYVENRTVTTASWGVQVNRVERPVYKWFNGLSDPAKHGPSHNVNRSSERARIAPFTDYKFKTIVDQVYNKIPLKLGVLFQTGDVYKAASDANDPDTGTPLVPPAAALEAELPEYNRYPAGGGQNINYVDAASYFLIGHRVQPKAKALKCADCHSSSSTLFNNISDADPSIGYTPAEVTLLKTVYGK